MAATTKFPKQLLSLQLDTVGDGSGTVNMNVDGSGTAVTYKVAPAADETFIIARVIYYIEDTGTFDAGKWGNGITLTNGVALKHKRFGTTRAIGAACKSTGDLAGMMHDISHYAFGTGNEIVSGRLTFTKFGKPLKLNGLNGDELQLVIQDNLEGLVAQRVTAQGYFVKR